MAILQEHVPYFEEVFETEGFLRDPVMVFGVQDCLYFSYNRTLRMRLRWRIKLYLQLLLKRRKFTGVRDRKLRNIPAKFRASTLQGVLANYGMRSVKTMDWFDPRADLRLDMNQPLPAELQGKFNTVVDIGCLEHVFDTRQALGNLFKLVRTDGHLCIHTVCNGCVGHGLHAFSPECLLQALELNGFLIKQVTFYTPEGVEVEDPSMVCDALILIVARKYKDAGDFVVPQQNSWKQVYRR